MAQAEDDRELTLADRISTDDAENEAIDLEPARLNLQARAVEF